MRTHRMVAPAVAAWMLAGMTGIWATTQANTADREHQGFFPVGVWYEGSEGETRQNLIPADPKEAAPLYDRNFADIAAHGINAVVVPNTPPAHHRALLDAAAVHDVRVIPELDHGGGEIGAMIRGAKPWSDDAVTSALRAHLSPIARHPALLRLQLLDEPPRDALGRYAKAADALRNFEPEVPPFCCVIGGEIVDAFVRETRSGTVAFDMYPIGEKTPPGDPAALRAFERQARTAALSAARQGAECWAVIQTHSITGIHRFPTPEEIRAMTWLSIATGSKGVWWFLYQTEFWNFEKSEKMRGLVDEEYRGDARWEEVGRLAREIRALAPELVTLKPIEDDTVCTASTGSVYAFSGPRDSLVVVAVNTDALSTRTLKLSAKSPALAGDSVRRLPLSIRVPARRDDGSVSWSVDLAPGAGAAFRVGSTVLATDEPATP